MRPHFSTRFTTQDGQLTREGIGGYLKDSLEFFPVPVLPRDFLRHVTFLDVAEAFGSAGFLAFTP